MSTQSSNRTLRRQFLARTWIGLLLAIFTSISAFIITRITGQVFGAWDWAEFVLVLTLLELLIITLLAGLDADPDPSLRRWHFVEDPQAEFPLMGAKPGMRLYRRIDPSWISIAIPLVVLAIVAVVVAIVS